MHHSRIKIEQKTIKQKLRKFTGMTKIYLIMRVFARQKLNRKLFVTQNNTTANKICLVK